ncbi:unnamed protein product [Mytilus edulis]|uniref:Uncharacterized protein n=1 Tax=Mytilus edulis TaxID=6550 RepID=A0A8S3QF07_MYTED|nr:unnamed protein product [Mytilus edulis]
MLIETFPNLSQKNEQRKEASELLCGETVKLNNIIHTYNGLRQSVEYYQKYIFKQKPTVTVTECLSSKCIKHTTLKSALKQVLKLINCQIAYLLTTWKHDAVLPNFQKDGCLRKDASENVHYDFGKDARIDKSKDQLCIDEKNIESICQDFRYDPMNILQPPNLRSFHNLYIPSVLSSPLFELSLEGENLSRELCDLFPPSPADDSILEVTSALFVAIIASLKSEVHRQAAAQDSGLTGLKDMCSKCQYLPLTNDGVFSKGLEIALEKRKEQKEQLSDFLPEFSRKRKFENNAREKEYVFQIF